MSTLYRFCQYTFVILYIISFIGHKMNQTQKRLSIIKLAISITDIETIQLQLLKLAPMKTDSKIQEILTLLQAGNYAQAQGLITDYIESAPEEILQRTSQDDTTLISDEDQAIIDEFNLFVTPQTHSSSETIEIDMNDYGSIEPKITKNKQTIDFDSLLNLDADDVLKDNINIDISQSNTTETTKDTFFQPDIEETFNDFLEENPIDKDTFFEEEVTEEVLSSSEENTVVLEEEITHITEPEDVEEKELDTTPISEETTDALSYAAMPHISQKLISMKKQYPPIQKSYEKFDTVETLLVKIAHEKYTESEIEETITYIYQCIKAEKYTEAAQLLLVCAATESKFAQFMLARELYTGSVLTKNINESFTIMNTLAINDYPEALCDLGQFYENGIGTTKNLIKAEGLYKEAVNLGIKRAKKHYNRLKKHNRGFFKG